MAGIAWRNEIKSQLQHWLNQAINPLGSQPPGLGGNHAARANSEFPTYREDTSICRGHAVLRCRRWAGNGQAAGYDGQRLVFAGKLRGNQSSAVIAIVADHHSSRYLG